MRVLIIFPPPHCRSGNTDIPHKTKTNLIAKFKEEENKKEKKIFLKKNRLSPDKKKKRTRLLNRQKKAFFFKFFSSLYKARELTPFPRTKIFHTCDLRNLHDLHDLHATEILLVEKISFAVNNNNSEISLDLDLGSSCDFE